MSSSANVIKRELKNHFGRQGVTSPSLAFVQNSPWKPVFRCHLMTTTRRLSFWDSRNILCCYTIYKYIVLFPYIYIRKTEQTENGNIRLFATNEKRKEQTPFVCCKRKRKTEVCFPCSTNDKRLSTFAVSANVPIYAKDLFHGSEHHLQDNIDPTTIFYKELNRSNDYDCSFRRKMAGRSIQIGLFFLSSKVTVFLSSQGTELPNKRFLTYSRCNS